MRILVVSDFYPWPEESGGRIRLGAVVRALASLGQVEVFALSARSLGAPPPSEVTRFAVGHRLSKRRRPADGLVWLALGTLPYSFHKSDYREARAAFRAWSRDRFDLAWFRGAGSYVALGDLVDAPSVIDFDDLEDRKLAAWLAAVASGKGGGRAAGTRRGWSRIRAGADRRRWRELQRRLARKVEAVTVCSELDRHRLAVSNAWVIPNGYTAPPAALGRVQIGDPPVLLFPGQFSYAPNLDGARYLVGDVLPKLRSRFPNAELRLVGRYDQRLEPLASEFGVSVTGRVPDMAPELARADIVAVPVRFGSGTRIKILEAFAHRIPVVSTSLGCEGLGAVNGRHLLVADQAESFAVACGRLLTDQALRVALTTSAQELYAQHYRWDAIAPLIVDLARWAAVSRREQPLAADSNPV